MADTATPFAPERHATRWALRTYCAACLLMGLLVAYLAAHHDTGALACTGSSQALEPFGARDLWSAFTERSLPGALAFILGTPLVMFLSCLPAVLAAQQTPRRWAHWLILTPPVIGTVITGLVFWDAIVPNPCREYNGVAFLLVPIMGVGMILGVTAVTSLITFAAIRLGRLSPPAP